MKNAAGRIHGEDYTDRATSRMEIRFGSLRHKNDFCRLRFSGPVILRPEEITPKRTLHDMNRRTFLKLSGAIVGSQLLKSSAVAADAPAQPITLNPGPQLFLDDFLIESQTNLQRVVTPPPRLPEPVITGKEDHNYQPYVSVIRDPQAKKFRVWYGVPSEGGQGDRSHLATMESDDGIHWKRPHRVLDDPGGLGVRFGSSVIDEGPAFSDPQKRYKFGWFNGPCSTPPVGGLMIATSPDGLAWKPIADHAPLLPHNHDINGIFRDPIRKRYGAIVSMIASEPGHYHAKRITFQSASDDCIHWATPWPILVPDERDEADVEFYAMAGIIARGDLLIGLVKVLQDDKPADAGGDRRGIGYTTLAYSRDGTTWTRDREAFLPRNPTPGSWDHAMTWADCQCPVDDEVFIYYGGYARGHKVERFTERQIGLARMKRDRYVALRAASESAKLRTKPVKWKGLSLTVNATVRGAMTVELLDIDGKSIGAPVSIDGDSTVHPVDFPNSDVHSGPVLLQFTMRDADLFAIDVT